ncbi:MAG: thioredoxin [Coriobacteriaceae bacterium]|nr:thioredoxin [Coriobacteriaceae bacterium]
MATIIEATPSTFDELIANELPVVIDFWAPWCGPCRTLGPVIEQLADELEGKIVVAKCNVDENQDLAMKYGVMSIPTVVMLKGGTEVMRSVGAVPKPKLQADIEAHL